MPTPSSFCQEGVSGTHGLGMEVMMAETGPCFALGITTLSLGTFWTCVAPREQPGAIGFIVLACKLTSVSRPQGS